MNYDDYAPRDDWKGSPVYKKAWEISIIVERIVSIQAEDGEITEDFEMSWFNGSQEYMQGNAMIICAKIAGAWYSIYDLQMENAAIIRKAARELITDARGLQMNGYKEIEYLDILRAEVEEFRILFAEWVKTFDNTNYSIDRWGLFNPPGVAYDDHDPEDDIPFDPEERMRMLEEFMGEDDDDESEAWKKGLSEDDDDPEANEDEEQDLI